MKATKIILTSFIFAIFLFFFVLSVPAASAAVSHSASQITAGTFGSGDFVFPNNLDVNENLFANSVLVNSWLYNQTAPANSYTNAVVSANNAAWTSTYNATYHSYATYSYNQTAPAQNYADTNFVKKSGDTMTGALVTTALNVSGQTLLATSSGNVGIGTTSPTRKLFVQDGEIRVATNGNGLSLLNSGASAGVTLKYDGTNNGLSIDNSVFVTAGNVGIGTASPAAKLEINTPVNSAGFYVFSPTLADGNYVYQTMGKSGNANEGFIFLYNHNSADASRYLQIGTNEGWNVGEGIRILGNGNVGIGTTSPAVPLAVSGAIRTFGATNTNRVQLLNAGQSAGVSLTYDTANDGLSIDNDVFVTAGNVGIGTTSPIAKLTVASDVDINPSITSNGQLILQGVTNSNKRISIGYDTTDGFGFIQPYENMVGYKDLVLQPHGGNVGIGTTSPVERLHIAGTGTGASFMINNTGINTGAWDIYSEDSTGKFVIRDYDASFAHRLDIDSKGSVTTPSQPRVRAYRSGSAQSVPNNQDVTLNFNTEDYDVGNNFDAGITNRFTAPVAGYYLVVSRLTFTAGGAETYILRVYKNGGHLTNLYTGSTAAGSHFIYYSDIIKLAANDWISIAIHQQAAGNRDFVAGSEYSYIAISLLG